MTTEKDSGDLERRALGYLALIVGTWIAVPIMFWVICSGDTNTSALVGDAFGTINSLFSGLALFGVAIAIFYQRHQLDLQKAESGLSQAEIRKQTAFMQDSALVSALPHLIEGERQLLRGIDPERWKFAYSYSELEDMLPDEQREWDRLRAIIDPWEAARFAQRLTPSDAEFTADTGLLPGEYTKWQKLNGLVPAMRNLAMYLRDLEETYNRLKPDK